MPVREFSDTEKNELNHAPGIAAKLALGSNLQAMQKAINNGGGGVDPYASQAEAETGVATNRAMNPLRVWQQIQHKLSAGGNVSFTPTPEGLAINASAPASTNYVFYPSAPAQTGNVYKVWSDLCAAIAALPDGEIPRIVFRESVTLPAAGMPVGGWNMRLGTWASPYIATGSTVVTIPDGVKIDNLTMIDNGLEVDCAPTTDDGVFANSLMGGVVILVLYTGAKLTNLGTKALISSAGQVVVVQKDATQTIAPVNTAPLVKVNGTDSFTAIILGDSNFSQWFDDFVIGGSPGSTLLFMHGVNFTAPVLNSWSGDAPIYMFGGRSKNVAYDDAAQSPASGATTAQGAIDWLKTQIGDPYASQAEAEAGTADDRAMNPLRTAQAIAALAPVGGDAGIEEITVAL